MAIIDVGQVAPATSRRSLAFAGARDITPMVIGLVPFGLAIGAAVRQAEIDPVAGWAGSFLLLAGSAHLTIVELLGSGAAPAVAVVAALVVNARVLMYGAALSPWFPAASLRRRLALAIPIVDPLYATAVARFERGDLDEDGRVAYYAGAALHLAAAWVVAQTVGVLVGAGVPDAVGLRAAAPLALVGLLATSTRGRAAQAAAAVAGVVAVVAAGLPYHAAVPVAAGAGVAVAARRGRP